MIAVCIPMWGLVLGTVVALGLGMLIHAAVPK